MNKIIIFLFLFVVSSQLSAFNMEEYKTKVQVANSQLPAKISDNMLLKNIKIVDSTLIYNYSLNIENSELKQAINSNKPNKQRVVDNFIQYIKKSALLNSCKSKFITDFNGNINKTIMKYRIYKTDIKFEVEVSKATCTRKKISIEELRNQIKVTINKTSKKIPMKMSKGIILKNISYDNDVIYQELSLERETIINMIKSMNRRVDLLTIKTTLNKIGETLAAKSKKQTCFNPLSREYLDMGIKYAFDLRWNNGDKISKFILDKSSCKNYDEKRRK